MRYPHTASVPPSIHRLRTVALLFALVLPAPLVAQFTQANEHTAPTESLLRDITIELDAEQKQTRTTRKIIRIIDADRAQYAATQVVDFNNSHEEIDVLSAATILPDGTRVELPTTATTKKPHELQVLRTGERRAHDFAPDKKAETFAYPENQRLTLTFSNLVDGATLDYEVRIRQTKPIIPGHTSGSISAWSYDGESATNRVTIVAEAPGALHITTNGIPATLQDGSLTWTPVTTDLESEADEDAPPSTLTFSTLPDWETLGTWASEQIKAGLIPHPDITAKAKALTAGTSREDGLRLITSFLQDDIGDVRVSFGERLTKPDPVACLANGLGDALDKSALLILMLRAIDIDAHPVLTSQPAADVPPNERPRLDHFGHLVVHLPDETLWIDPTAGFLDLPWHPATLVGSHALVIDDTPDTLERIPGLPTEANIYRATSEFTLYPDGFVIDEGRIQGEGQQAMYLRKRWPADLEKQKETLRNQFRYSHQFAGFLDFHFESGRQEGTPATLRSRNISQKLRTTAEGLDLSIPIGTFVNNLNYDRSYQSGVIEEDGMMKFLSGGIHEFDLRVNLPFGMRLKQLPKSETLSFISGDLEFKTHETNGVVHVYVRSEHKPATIPLDEADDVLKKLHDDIQSFLDRANFILVDQLSEALKNDPVPTLQRLADRVARHPEDAALRARYAEFLKRAGRIASAEKQLRESIALEPKQRYGYASLLQTRTFAGKGTSAEDISHLNQLLRDMLAVTPSQAHTYNIFAGYLYGPASFIQPSDENIREIITISESLLTNQVVQSAAAERLFHLHLHLGEFAKARDVLTNITTRTWNSAADTLTNHINCIDGDLEATIETMIDDARFPRMAYQRAQAVLKDLVKHRKFSRAKTLLEETRHLAGTFETESIDASITVLKDLATLKPLPPIPPDSPESVVASLRKALATSQAVEGVLADHMFPSARLVSSFATGVNIARQRNAPLHGYFDKECLALATLRSFTFIRTDLPCGSAMVQAKPRIKGHPDIKYFLYPDENDDWRIYSVHTEDAGEMSFLTAPFALDLYRNGKTKEATLMFDRLEKQCGEREELIHNAFCKLRTLDFSTPLRRYEAITASSLIQQEQTLARWGKFALPALAEHPKDPLIVYLRMHFAQALKDKALFADASQRYREQNPGLENKITMSESMLLFELGEFDAALDLLTPLHEEDPSEAFTRRQIALIHAHKGRAKEAYEYARPPRKVGLGALFGRKELVELGGPELEVIRILQDTKRYEELNFEEIPRHLRDHAIGLGYFYCDMTEESPGYKNAVQAYLTQQNFVGTSRLIWALFAAGQTEDAEALIRRLHEFDAQGTYRTYLLTYAAYNPGEAVKHIRKHIHSFPSPYPAISLYLHEQILGEPADPSFLRNFPAHRFENEWQPVLIAYALGDIDYKEALTAARNTPLNERMDYLTELYCYRGMRAEIAGNLPEARQAYQDAIDLAACLNIEFNLCVRRLARIAE